ncbi:MAG: hypothetical protein HWN81_15875 [Candidatus Lokiarchaeota archaeon]|nr:hypothetical protein [Candidatus Lokiarchaeota archaeon]
MAENVDLKSLERKAYRSIFEDGVWDLFIGLIILSLGFSTFLSSILNLNELWFAIIPTLILNIIAFLIFFLGKKFITIPRLGIVKFGQKRKSKQQKLKLFLFIFFILNIIFLILPFTDLVNFIQFKPLIIALILGLGAITLPFVVVAYFLDFIRLYFYAILAGLGFFLTELLYPIVGTPLDILLPFGITGGVIVVIGLYYFITFLKKYPLTK